MATLSYDQMAQYAALAGLPNPSLWAAIGMAESSGRTDVVNSIGCVGWLQINQPVWVHSHPSWTPAWLKNPRNNAMAAKVIYKAQGLKAWEGYTSGRWRDFYKGDASKVVQAGLFDGGSPGMKGLELGAGALEKYDPTGILGLTHEVSRISQATGKAGNWLGNPRNWVRIGYVGAGTLLIVVGVQMVVSGKLLTKAAPLLGGAVTSKVKAVRGAATARKAEQAAAARDAAKRQARVAEAYEKTRARAQARQDAKAADDE